MSSPHPLNQAVIAQALHDLRNGKLRRWRAMGCSAKLLEALKHPELVSLLANSQVSWCSVRINQDVAHRLLDQEQNVQKEISTVDRMLLLGASTEMVSEFHGLSHQEVALRRQMLNLPQRKGRWRVLTEDEDAALWKRWQSRIKANGVELDDDSAMLSIAMDLAQEQSLPLSVVWNAIRDWIRQGLT